jgi:hypothetical protein
VDRLNKACDEGNVDENVGYYSMGTALLPPAIPRGKLKHQAADNFREGKKSFHNLKIKLPRHYSFTGAIHEGDGARRWRVRRTGSSFV